MRKIKKGDTVIVVKGKWKSAGGVEHKGQVRRVLPEKNKVIVEGVNLIKKHVRPRPGVQQAGIVEMEAPISISNVMLICKHCNRPTRVGFRFLPDGSKRRYCKKCDQIID